jgi:hypothetical protein
MVTAVSSWKMLRCLQTNKKIPPIAFCHLQFDNNPPDNYWHFLQYRKAYSAARSSPAHTSALCISTGGDVITLWMEQDVMSSPCERIGVTGVLHIMDHILNSCILDLINDLTLCIVGNPRSVAFLLPPVVYNTSILLNSLIFMTLCDLSKTSGNCCTYFRQSKCCL